MGKGRLQTAYARGGDSKSRKSYTVPPPTLPYPQTHTRTLSRTLSRTQIRLTRTATITDDEGLSRFVSRRRRRRRTPFPLTHSHTHKLTHAPCPEPCPEPNSGSRPRRRLRITRDCLDSFPVVVAVVVLPIRVVCYNFGCTIPNILVACVVMVDR